MYAARNTLLGVLHACLREAGERAKGEGGQGDEEGDARGKRSKLDCQKSSQAAEEVMIVSRADK